MVSDLYTCTPVTSKAAEPQDVVRIFLHGPIIAHLEHQTTPCKLFDAPKRIIRTIGGEWPHAHSCIRLLSLPAAHLLFTWGCQQVMIFTPRIGDACRAVYTGQLLRTNVSTNIWPIISLCERPLRASTSPTMQRSQELMQYKTLTKLLEL